METNTVLRVATVLVPLCLVLVVTPVLVWGVSRLLHAKLSWMKLIALIIIFIFSLGFAWGGYMIFPPLAFSGIVVQVVAVKQLAKLSLLRSVAFSALFNCIFSLVSMLPIYLLA